MREENFRNYGENYFLRIFSGAQLFVLYTDYLYAIAINICAKIYLYLGKYVDEWGKLMLNWIFPTKLFFLWAFYEAI